MSKAALIYCPFGSADEARRIARKVVEERLAACANILGTSQSIYRWQGAIAEEQETVALFKVPADRAAALTDRIAALHSYDVPAILTITATNCPPAFAVWLSDQTQAG